MTRHAACSCGQLHLTIEGEPSRNAMCHCLACQRRTGAVISNQARFRNDQVTITGKSTAWKRTADSYLSFVAEVPAIVAGFRSFRDGRKFPAIWTGGGSFLSSSFSMSREAP